MKQVIVTGWVTLVLAAQAWGATYFVVHTNDVGPGSLRQAIADANNNPGVDMIRFNIPGSPPFSIRPGSALPVLVDPVILDATTQPGYAGQPLVELNGATAGASANGLWVAGGNSAVRGFVINRFGNYGILISGGGSNLVQGSFIGIDLSGQNNLANGQGAIGILDSAGNTVGGLSAATRNVLSGRHRAGLYINGTQASNNVVVGNFIGTDLTGGLALGSASNGVLIADAPFNVVGGTINGARNLISASGQSGVYIFGATAVGNQILGNFIGTDVTGTLNLGNLSDGVTIYGARNTQVGGSTAGAGNLISGNQDFGVFIGGLNASGNVVEGNLIGTDVTGTASLGNRYSGVRLEDAADNRIGGTAAKARNLISGNRQSGISIAGAGSSNNLVQGNWIGLDATGTRALSNSFDGVSLRGAAGNTIGGSGAGAGNVISGNGLFGIYITNAPAPGNIIQGNLIGTDAAGQSGLGNKETGVGLWSAVTHAIGGAVPGAGNVISGNGQLGIYLTNGSQNVIQGNHIGTGVAGTEVLSNRFDGILISSSPDNTIGGTTSAARNLVSNNRDGGIYIFGAASQRNIVQGNFIGTDRSGFNRLPNGLDGVAIFAGSSNLVGGTVLGAANLLSGNIDSGVYLLGAQARGNRVQGNFIGVGPDSLTQVGNQRHGILVGDSASGNILGGTAPNEANLIAYSRQAGYDGVRIQSGTNNLIAGNSICFNVGLGIDLGPDGVSPNDLKDPDEGANRMQNFPVITSAVHNNSSTEILGTLNTESNKSYRIELFANAVPNSSGYGEGQTFLGSLMVTANAQGNASFNHTYPAPVPPGHGITATATDPLNNTSEFSQAFPVAGSAISADLRVLKTFSRSPAALGSDVTCVITVHNLGPSHAHDVRLVETLPAHLAYVSASPAPRTQFGEILTFNLGTVSSGSMTTITLVLRPTALGSQGSQSTVVSPAPDPMAANNSLSTTVTVVGPELRIERVGGQVVLSWAAVEGFLLQAKTSVAATEMWGDVSTPPVLVSGRYQVALGLASGNRFFQLRQQ